MIDFIRSNHAQLLAVISFLIVWAVLYLAVKKYVPVEQKSLSRKIFSGVIVFVLFVYFMFALRFASVNNVPRTNLDQSVKQNREQYLERDAKKTIEKSKNDSI